MELGLFLDVYVQIRERTLCDLHRWIRRVQSAAWVCLSVSRSCLPFESIFHTVLLLHSTCCVHLCRDQVLSGEKIKTFWLKMHLNLSV